MPDDLGEYEGKPIRKMAVEVKNTSGGLHAAMKVHPDRIRPGETRFVCYEVTFDKFRFDPMDDGDAWCLVPIGSASTAAFLDEATVRESLEASRLAQIALDEEKKGLRPMEPIDRIEEHNAGLHKRKRKDCDECQAEVAEAKRIAAEQGTGPKPRKPRKPRNLASVE